MGRRGEVSSRCWDRHGPAPGQGSEGPATGPGPAPGRGLALLGAMTRLWACVDFNGRWSRHSPLSATARSHWSTRLAAIPVASQPPSDAREPHRYLWLAVACPSQLAHPTRHLFVAYRLSPGHSPKKIGGQATTASLFCRFAPPSPRFDTPNTPRLDPWRSKRSTARAVSTSGTSSPRKRGTVPEPPSS